MLRATLFCIIFWIVWCGIYSTVCIVLHFVLHLLFCSVVIILYHAVGYGTYESVCIILCVLCILYCLYYIAFSMFYYSLCLV